MSVLATLYKTAVKNVPVYKYSGILFIALFFLVVASKYQFNSDEVVKYSLIIIGLCFLGFLLAFFTKTQDLVIRVSLYILVYAIVLTTAIWILGLATFLITDGQYPKMIGRILSIVDNQPNITVTANPTQISNDTTNFKQIVKPQDKLNTVEKTLDLSQQTSISKIEKVIAPTTKNESEKTEVQQEKKPIRVEPERREELFQKYLEWRYKTFEGTNLSISNVNSFRDYPLELTELDINKDFKITVTLKSTRGNGSTRFGIAWNFFSDQDYFLFTLHNENRESGFPSADAFYTIGRGKCDCDQNFVRIKEGVLTSVNANSYQDLSIIKDGDNLKFYINKTLVWTTTSYSLQTNKIAFWVADNSEATFNKAVIYQQ